MASVNFESLTKPVSAEAPCGEDLDLSGDLDYLNFIAGAEGLLPKSFFGKDQSGNEGRPFDRGAIDFEAQFSAAQPFLDKTRDLRMLGILAKFCILNRDFDGFCACIRAMSTLLAEHWNDVHPRAEDGDFGLRMVAVESIEAFQTVVMPLQFQPLVEHKRFGGVSYRNYLIAKGEIAPSEGETAVDLATIEKTLQEVELSVLVERRQQVIDLDAAIKQIRSVWTENCTSGPSVGLDRLPGSVAGIFEMLNTAIVKRDPTAGLAAPAADGAAEDTAAAPAVTAGQVNSAANAGRALAAVATYFGRNEPSNPALMLVRQAQDLVGKSFLEVIQLLVPDQIARAAVNIGREQFFDLPIERLATATGSGPAQDGGETGDGQADPQFDVRTRGDALTLLEQVGVYFRAAEPSSPIPFFTDRARDLATRDFLSVLKALLPPDTLRTN